MLRLPSLRRIPISIKGNLQLGRYFTVKTIAPICVATRRQPQQFSFIWKTTAIVATAALVTTTETFALEENERKKKKNGKIKCSHFFFFLK